MFQALSWFAVFPLLVQWPSQAMSALAPFIDSPMQAETARPAD